MFNWYHAAAVKVSDTLNKNSTIGWLFMQTRQIHHWILKPEQMLKSGNNTDNDKNKIVIRIAIGWKY